MVGGKGESLSDRRTGRRAELPLCCLLAAVAVAVALLGAMATPWSGNVLQPPVFSTWLDGDSDEDDEGHACFGSHGPDVGFFTAYTGASYKHWPQRTAPASAASTVKLNSPSSMGLSSMPRSPPALGNRFATCIASAGTKGLRRAPHPICSQQCRFAGQGPILPNESSHKSH